MKKRICIITVVFVLSTFVLTSCRQTPSDDTVTTTTAPTTATTAAVIEQKLDEMLTAKEISEAVGVEMGKPTVSGQGTILTSIGVSSKAVMSIVVSEKPIDIFYYMLQGYKDLQACPNLGETAWFSPIHNQLLVYGKGFMITVELTGTNDDQNVQKLRCRQIAALLLEEL